MAMGDLRKRMTLQSESIGTDGSGGQQAIWATVDVIWADMAPVTRESFIITQEFNRRITHRITVRYRADILVGMRLVYGNRLFTIRALINQSETNRWLDLMVEEGGTLG